MISGTRGISSGSVRRATIAAIARRSSAAIAARFAPTLTFARERYTRLAAQPCLDKSLVLDETAEDVAFVGRDPVDAETRRPGGRSPGLRAAVEANRCRETDLRIRHRTFSSLRRFGAFVMRWRGSVAAPIQ